MRSDWAQCTVAALEAEGVLLVQDGNHGNDRPRRDEFVGNGVAFVRAADLDRGAIRFDTASRVNSVALRRIRKGVGAPGDVLLSHKGTVGRVALAPLNSEPFVCSPQTTFWRTLDERRLNRLFLFYFLQGPFFTAQLNAVKGETDMADYVSLTNQRQLVLAIPPIEEQNAIAGVLKSLDTKIALENVIAETVESVMRTQFRHDVVEKLADPPTSWRHCSLSDVATFVNGRAITKEANGLGRPILRIRELKSDIDASTLYTDVEVADEHLARFGDLLFAWSGSLGSYRWHGPESAINQHIFKVIPRDTALWFVEQWLEHHMPTFLAIAAEKATTMGHIQRHHLDEAQVLVPEPAQLRSLDSFFSDLEKRRSASAELTRDLTALRNDLLPRLVTGRLRVSDATHETGRVPSAVSGSRR